MPLVVAMALVACDGACAADTAPERPGSEEPAAATAEATATPPWRGRGRVAFIREREERRALFVFDLATGEVEPLAKRDHDLYAGPARGEELLVISAEDQGELHREQLWRWRDGKLSKLGEAARMIRNPSWLPDGSGVVFESSRDAFRELYLATETGNRRLTKTRQGAFEPAVHPDGERIAYVTSDEGNPELFVRPLDEEGQARRLTWSKGDDTSPRWSPDGTQLAWVSVRDGVGQIFVMGAGGTKPHALAASPRDQTDPRWSPDGSHLAFVERREGRHASVVVIRTDGTRRTDTGATSVDEGPSWSPDGRYVAFSSDRTGDPELYVLDLDDDAVHQLTRDPGPDWLPRWLP